MPGVTRPTIHHVGLTVTDLDASIAWYEKIFDITYQLEVPHEGGTGKVLTDGAWQLMVALHHHDANQSEPCAETRTGLDHVGFPVLARADLEIWQKHLEACGVRRSPVANRPYTQSPIADLPFGSFLVFRDPDNIQLELFAPPNS
jgi:glyoxylase I family protein